MLKKTLILLLLSILSYTSISQEINSKQFLIMHNMLSCPDTVTFYFWQESDTLFARKIVHEFTPTREDDLKIMSFKQQYGDNVITGAKLFNGKNILYRIDTEKFIIKHDTLYKEIICNKLSVDSIKTLFGDSKSKTFNESEFQKNMEIISNNRSKRKIILFHPTLFEKENKYVTKNNSCSDTITLIKKWQKNDTTYYVISYSSDCSLYSTQKSFIIDDKYNFYAFDKKYLALDFAPQTIIKPFRPTFKLK